MFVLTKSKYMKATLILLLCVTSFFAQIKMPQLTRYNKVPFSIADTVNKNAEGVLVTIYPAVAYFYNTTDSVLMTPLCFIPYFRNEKHYGAYMTEIEVFLEDKSFKVNSAKLIINAVDCDLKPEWEEDTIANFEISLIDSNYVLHNDQGTFIDLQIKNWQNFGGNTTYCNTKDVELTINGKTFIPKQERIETDYFTKVNDFIELVSLKTDFENSNKLYEEDKKLTLKLHEDSLNKQK